MMLFSLSMKMMVPVSMMFSSGLASLSLMSIEPGVSADTPSAAARNAVITISPRMIFFMFFSSLVAIVVLLLFGLAVFGRFIVKKSNK